MYRDGLCTVLQHRPSLVKQSAMGPCYGLVFGMERRGRAPCFTVYSP